MSLENTAITNQTQTESYTVASLLEALQKKDDELKEFKGVVLELKETIKSLQSLIANLQEQNNKKSENNVPKNNNNSSKRRNFDDSTASTSNSSAKNDSNNSKKQRKSNNKGNGSWVVEPINPNHGKQNNGSQNNTNAILKQTEAMLIDISDDDESTQNSNTTQNTSTDQISNNGQTTNNENQINTPQSTDIHTVFQNSENNTESSTVQHQQIESIDNDWQFVSHKNKKENNNKIQPIQVTVSQEGTKALYQILTSNIGTNNFTVNQLKSKTSVRIYPASNTIADQIIELLSNHQYEFHSYLNDKLKKKCFLIKGLNGFNNIDALLDQFIKAGFPENTMIAPFSTGYQRANPNLIHNNYFKLIVNGNMDEKILNNINSVFGFSITFEKLKSSSVIQCHNCQQYFHTASMCYRKYRCVKCIKDHNPGECPNNDNITLEPQCVNCKGFHTANNYSKCEYYKQKIDPFIKRKTNTNAIQSKNSTNGASISKPHNILNKSFADVIKGDNNSKNVSKQASPTSNTSNTSDTKITTNHIENMFTIMVKMLENQEKMMNHLINNNKS